MRHTLAACITAMIVVLYGGSALYASPTPPTPSSAADMASAKNTRVKSWLPLIRQTRRDMGLVESSYSDALVLALIDVESDGDPYANRDGSQFHGLLQMGWRAGVDVGFTKTNPSRLTTAALLGDPRLSLEKFFQFQERYSHLHEYEPMNVALLWKIGPGAFDDYAFSLSREQALIDIGGPTEDRGIVPGSGYHYLYGDGRFNDSYEFWAGGESDEVTTTLRAPSGAFIRRPGFAMSRGCIDSSVGDATAPRTATTPPRARAANLEERRVAQGASASVLDYIGGNYVGSLDAFAQTADVRSTAGNRGWTRGDARVIRGFIADVENNEGTNFTFQATLFDIAATYVKPLVDPTVRQTFGQARSTAPSNPETGRDELRNPETGELMFRRHLGVDYETRESQGSLGKNQLCYAIAGGTVRVARALSFYGLVVYIEHKNGVSSRYAHLSEILVNNGDTVHAGQPVGRCGESTTRSSGSDGFVVQHGSPTFIPHLHFELRVNLGVVQEGEIRGSIVSNTMNVAIDPVPLLSAAPNPGETPPDRDPEMEKLLHAKEVFATIATQSSSPGTSAEAANNFDMAAAFLRGEQFSRLSRGDFYAAQARNTAAQTDPAVPTTLQLDDG